MKIYSDLESREHGRRNPSRSPRGTFYPQKLALTSPTSGSRLVDIVRSSTDVTELFFREMFTVTPEAIPTAYVTSPALLL
jgi:hypothetical protein